MKAIEFPQQHDILAKDQPEYLPLPVHYKTEPVKFKDADGNEVVKDVVMEVTACFQLEAEEIAQVIATGELYYTQCVYGQKFQPVRMSVINPFEPAPSEYHNHDNKNYGLPVEVVQTIRHAFLEISQDSYTNDGTNYSELVENALMYISNNLKPKNEHTQAAPEQSPITRLVEALNNDPEYREGWRANLAAAFLDAVNAHTFYQPIRGDFPIEIKGEQLFADFNEVTNKAAENFLNQLCNEKTD